jgi:hypothetical protein
MHKIYLSMKINVILRKEINTNSIPVVFINISLVRSDTLLLLYKVFFFTLFYKPRVIALLCFWTSALEGGEVSASRPGRFTPGKDPVPILQKAGWAPGPVWTGAEILAPTGIRSPDRPARSKSLYRLSYPAHTKCMLSLISMQAVQF